MKITSALVFLVLGVAVSAVKQEASFERYRHAEDHRREGKQRINPEQRPSFEEHGGSGKPYSKKHEEHQHESFEMDERTKEVLLKQKSKTPVFVNAMVDYVLSSENRKFERECFDKFEADSSVDFVIDIAPSPSEDKWDRYSAESPLAYYLDIRRETPSQAYFTAIQMFIDAITYQLKPEMSHSIIVNHGRKYYIQGKSVEEESTGKLSGDFSDKARNLKTLWPEPTNEVVSALGSAQTKKLETVIENNLGRMTKLALWNRDNGLPTVLGASRRYKPVYTFVITDGSSGTRLNELTDDLTRTTIIDIGNRRFIKSLDWEDMRRLVNVISLCAPQELSALIDTCRFVLCKSRGCC